ncbi:MAG TPA: RNHCP domain-containing protein [Patescibacteria group bacterium]|nr:RNHCP domain-containing protein [Patescibacteria group bacterium]
MYILLLVYSCLSSLTGKMNNTQLFKKFQRTIENFVCQQCGTPVQGDGYRNHCPQCLVSKHVDVNPGDRQANCGGLMDVVDIKLQHGGIVLTHQCRICGHKKRNKMHAEDNNERLVQLMEIIKK